MKTKNILFIHGFGGGSYEFKPIKSFLKKKFTEEIIFFDFVYEKRFGQVELENIAELLKTFIENNLKDKNFSVIAISQGGIIWRIFALKNRYLTKKVEKVITLCTPHNGSLWANLLNLPGVKDLRKNSQILNRINELDDGLEYYSVYNPLDLMVFPGTNAIFKKAKINKRVFDWLHPLTFWNKKTLNFIEETLKS
ncbi:MAG: alpha/beta fold hydrolase [Candidatus Paceibacterota bacterium]